MTRSEPYLPIAEYALIGNRHTCALVARDGSIDWCCLPRLDSPSIFAAILDHARGGRWRVAPAGEAKVTRSYLGHSAVLESVFETPGGVLRLRDFLPIRRGRGNETSRSAHAIVRTALCIEGEIDLEIEWMPRPNYARDDVSLAREGDVVWARTRAGTLWLSGIPAHQGVKIEGAGARARVTLRTGAGLDLVSGEGKDVAGPLLADRYLDETLEWWDEWLDVCCVPDGAEEWRELMLRSGMVLKLLTDEGSGAIAAAPTTSLPEEIGGIRNWDYRFCWVRDATLISRALNTLGHAEEGTAFLRFLETASAQHHDPARVQVLYRLDGSVCVAEYDLGHLDGYRDSRPVRVGNAAAIQRQLDVYGELIQAAVDLVRNGVALSDSQWEWLAGVADYVCKVWELKDRGIWEVRGPEMNFVYSKLMCWVALDRAIGLAEAHPTAPERLQLWRTECERIRAAILERGFDRERNCFVQSFENHTLDASNLLIPMTGFLPASDPRVQGTIDATLRELTENGLVHRYLTDETPDGVSGSEGAFGICTFWLVDALALSDRVEEAQEIFEKMAARANDVGLYPEEINPCTGEFLGNYPQAFTHVGLVNSVHELAAARVRARDAAHRQRKRNPDSRPEILSGRGRTGAGRS